MTPLVLLSGWGCDARIWQPLATHWPAGIRVETPDWPGYAGRPAPTDPAALDAVACAMAPELSADAVWVGWSLGGLLAAALLERLPTPRGLIMIGMGPRFCHPQGVPIRELAAFHRAFARNPDATLAYFRRWQLSGEPDPRAAHRQLRHLLGAAPGADTPTLAAGLDWLTALDVSATLAAPPCPVHTLAGADDPLLAPSRVAAADRRLDGAGHCPMLSRPDTLAAALVELARECPRDGATFRRPEACPL